MIDEANFHVSGLVNTQNMRHLLQNNRRRMHENSLHTKVRFVVELERL